MRGYVANTDYDWFTFLRAIEPPIDEVNFWRPGSETSFRAVDPGEPFFFKLKAPRNAIAGFGYFAHFSLLPVSMAWEIYREANGARTFGQIRERLLRFRSRFGMETDPKQDFWIGCILVNQTVFFREDEWVRVPDDFTGPIVQGKTYDLSRGEGERIWLECVARAARRPYWIGVPTEQRSMVADAPMGGGYGLPKMVRPRLANAAFESRCSIRTAVDAL